MVLILVPPKDRFHEEEWEVPAVVPSEEDNDEDTASSSSSAVLSSSSSSSSSSTNSKKRKREEYIIPGLTSAMFYCVSRYGSSNPVIQSFSRNDAGHIDASWNVSGSASSPYIITVQGKVNNIVFRRTKNYRGIAVVNPIYSGLKVSCRGMGGSCSCTK